MKMNKEHGGISFGDLLTVALIGVVAYLVYSRGYVDGYLPEQYTARTILGGGQEEATPEGAQKTEQAAVQVAAPQPTHEEARPAAPAQSAHPAAPVPADVKKAAADVAVAAVPGQAKTAIDIKKLETAKLPLKVKLLQRVEFPLMINGKEAGKVSSPPGTLVRLVELRESDLVVEHGGSMKTIPIGDTDVLERIHAIISVSGAATQGAPGKGFQQMRWNNMNKTMK